MFWNPIYQFLELFSGLLDYFFRKTLSMLFIGVSSSTFKDSGIKLKSLVNFELMFVQCER